MSDSESRRPQEAVPPVPESPGAAETPAVSGSPVPAETPATTGGAGSGPGDLARRSSRSDHQDADPGGQAAEAPATAGGAGGGPGDPAWGSSRHDHHQTDPGGQAAEGASPTRQGDRRPTPRLSRVGRGAVSLAAVAGMCVLLVLTLRYSRQSLESAQAGRPQIPAPPPTEVEQIERYRPPRREAPVPPPVAPPAVPASPAIRPSAPSRDLEAALRSPVVAGRASSTRPERTGRDPAAAGPGDLPTFEELRREVFGEERSGAGPAGFPEANPFPPLGPDPDAGSTARRNLLASPGDLSRGALVLRPGRPASPFVLQAGTFLPAVLAHRVISDQPGLLRAVLSRDVHDSRTGRHLLLPRGTVLLGRQDDLPTLGQERLAIVWDRLQLPDGTTLDLTGSGAAPAAALDGTAGLTGRVRQHWGRRYGAAVLLSLVGAGVQLSQPQRRGDDGLDPGQLAAGSLGLELGRLSQQILRQYADLPPTIELVPGARLHVVLTRDLVMPAPYRTATTP